MEEYSKLDENKIKFPVTSGMDIIKRVENEPPLKMLWGDIPKNSIGLIVGQAKTGKTTFAENLAISLATGKKSYFNQELQGIPQKVLFLNFEESYRLRGQRNQKQVRSLNEKEKDLFAENFMSIPEGFPEFLNEEKDWEAVKSYIAQINPDVVFMDSITRMCIGEIEKSSVAQKFFNKMHKYIFSDDRTFICVHHAVKNNSKPIGMNLIGGSRVVTQEFEYGFGMSTYPRSNGNHYGAMLFNKYKEFDPEKAFVYKINNEGWVDFIKEDNAYKLFYGSKTEPKDGRIDERNRDLILKTIESLGSPDSPAVSSSRLIKNLVKEKKKMSRSTFFENLKILKQRGDLVEESRGKYKLNKTEEDESGEK